MTITSLSPSKWLASSLWVALVASPALVSAQQNPQPPRPQPPVQNTAVLQQAQRNWQAQQSVNQANLQNQLQKQQAQEQRRQQQANAIRQPYANDPASARAIDSANQAQYDRYDAGQRDAVDRYRTAVGVTPPVVPATTPAVSAQQQPRKEK